MKVIACIMKRKDNEHIRVYFHLDSDPDIARSEFIQYLKKHPSERAKYLRNIHFKNIISRTKSIDNLCDYAVRQNVNLKYFTRKQEIHIDLPKHQLTNTSIHEKENHSTTTPPGVSHNNNPNGRIALTTFLGDVIFKHSSSDNTQGSGSFYLKGYIKTSDEFRIPDYCFTQNTAEQYNRQMLEFTKTKLPHLNGKGQNIAILNLSNATSIEKHTNIQQQFSNSPALNTEMQLLFMMLPEASLTIYHDVSVLSALKTCLSDRVNSADIIINPYTGYEHDYTQQELRQFNKSLLKAAMSDMTVLSYQNSYKSGSFAGKSTPANSPYVLGCQTYITDHEEKTGSSKPTLTFKHKSNYCQAPANQYNLIFWAVQVAKLNQALGLKTGCINHHFVKTLDKEHIAGNETNPVTNLQYTSGFSDIHKQLYRALKVNERQ
jgi:hypothetical protein